MTQLRPLVGRTEGRRTNEALVRSIPEPEFTDSWHPYSHGKVIDATALACEKVGLEVDAKSYSLSSGGDNMFGLWQVGRRNGKHNCLGFRNSVNKSLSIGYLSVLTVIICTNQVTNGNFFLLRRHTSGLTTAELSELAEEAIGKVVQDFNVTDQWHEDLREIKLERRRAESMVVRAMRQNVLAPSRFAEFDKLYFGVKDEKPVYDSTLYGFHGALTQLIRQNNFQENVWQNQRITAFVNKVKEAR